MQHVAPYIPTLPINVLKAWHQRFSSFIIILNGNFRFSCCTLVIPQNFMVYTFLNCWTVLWPYIKLLRPLIVIAYLPVHIIDFLGFVLCSVFWYIKTPFFTHILNHLRCIAFHHVYPYIIKPFWCSPVKLISLKKLTVSSQGVFSHCNLPYHNKLCRTRTYNFWRFDSVMTNFLLCSSNKVFLPHTP